MNKHWLTMGCMFSLFPMVLGSTPSHASCQEGYVSITGGKVWYQIVSAEKKETPLLTLHGGPGGAHDYLEPLILLSDERPVIFYDQLGCGNSDRPQNPSLWTVEHFVEELKQLREILSLDKIHILGQSWGSMLTVDYWLNEHPEGVVSFIFSGLCLSASRFTADQRSYLKLFPKEIQQTITKNEAAGCFDSPEYQEAMMKYYKRHLCRLEPWPDCLNRSFEKMGHEVYEYMWGPSELTVTGTL